MTKKDFIKKYKIGEDSVYHYKKRFPEIAKGCEIDFQKLDDIIQEREEVKLKVKQIMKKRKPIEIEFLFSTKNKKAQAHIFMYQLKEKKKQILVRDSNYKKYLQIIEHFGE